MSSHRQGTRTTSCRRAPPIMLIAPLPRPEAKYRHRIQQWADGHRAQFIFRVHKFLFSFSVQTKKREIVEEQHFLRISRFVSRLVF